ncbi:MAG: WYL domain-containing protein, partial [Magnetococcales bacterium]|nr:WYL domain-containing protein [Magnetococcales bacterium]
TSTSAYHLRETPLSEEQHWTTLDNGWVRIEATVTMTAQLRWWLLGFGHQVEVVAPESLRQEMAAIARQMVQHYDATNHGTLGGI